MSRRLATILLCVLLAWPAAVRAEHASVRRAQRAYAGLRFEDVLREIAEARRGGGLAHADEIELTRLEAYTYAVYDDGPRAVDAFQRLLGLDGTWTPSPETSPKIRRYFQEAKSRGARRPVASPAVVEPRPTLPAPDETPPFYASPWFWGSLAGAVLAGAGVGLLLSRDDLPTPRGNLGTVELP